MTLRIHRLGNTSDAPCSSNGSHSTTTRLLLRVLLLVVVLLRALLLVFLPLHVFLLLPQQQ